MATDDVVADELVELVGELVVELVGDVDVDEVEVDAGLVVEVVEPVVVEVESDGPTVVVVGLWVLGSGLHVEGFEMVSRTASISRS